MNYIAWSLIILLAILCAYELWQCRKEHSEALEVVDSMTGDQ